MACMLGVGGWVWGRWGRVGSQRWVKPFIKAQTETHTVGRIVFEDIKFRGFSKFCFK